MDPVLNDERKQLVRQWMDHCIDHHPECGNREVASVFPDSAEILLIDVQRMRLVKSTTTRRYLALSYVWGQVPQFTTRVENLETSLWSDSLQDVLSEILTVIQNAIRLAVELKERYLWVDSLCIVQNDASIKHSQLALIAEIYNSATATIIVCAAPDASTGLCPSSHSTAQSELITSTSYETLSEYPFDFEGYRHVHSTGIRPPWRPELLH
ncbi:heterokaryon incompatibility protein-domain-containing protein [Rhexocercosporidium sp. MPI-PUGE-AT-0058]|nr:heterokaryon incompatibility protein-domain-containing protein [Rhexocercosporidium sp. MPI-PUGE-AT-0058]